ncbi:MAG: hypothetical protein ACR2LL_08690 [Nitrosopumilus sp.]
MSKFEYTKCTEVSKDKVFDAKVHHATCYQWGHAVFCHGCQTYVASSYVSKFFKKPSWLSDEQIADFEQRAVSE